MSGYVGERSPLRTFGLLSLRRRWRLVAGCGALFLIAGLLVVVLKPARYTSSTQLLVYVRQLQPGPDLVVTSGRADLTQVQNEIEIVRSRGMLAKVVGALNLVNDNEVVPAPTLFRVLSERFFRGSQSAPENARTKLERAVDFLDKHVTAKRVGTSHTILVSVTTSDPSKSERIANAIGQVALQARVSAEQEGNRSPLLRERLQGLGPAAYVMSIAGAPGRPDGPRTIVVILAALLSGLAVGSALALVLDLMNRTMRTAAQVEHLGMECIGAIPQVPTDAGELRPSAMLDQTLRRAMTAIAASKARTVGITSAVTQEGATTIAKHLAQIAARSRKKVLFVEAAAWRRCDPDWLRTYDLVVVNLPPLESGPEFRMAANDIDRILLVIKWGSTEFERIERAIAASGVAASEFIGAVLNMVDDRMIGKFGDKLWEAEAALVARRDPLGFSIPAERPVG